MLVKIVKTSIILNDEKEGKKYLWAFVDEYDRTMVQIYSEKYPKELEEFLKR
jgi:predicted choloylglycine hydrolase